MGFLILGLAYLLDYLNKPTFRHQAAFVLCIQLALSANLSLIPLVVLLWLLLLYFQYHQKRLAARWTVVLNISNLLLLLFWLKFLLFLRTSGMLDSGAADGYWNITFVSLIEMIFGSKALWLQILLLLMFGLSLYLSFRVWQKQTHTGIRIFQKPVFFTLLFSAMVAGIFLQHILLDVNYPEDRTGLYFYVLYTLMLVFSFDTLPELFLSFLSPLFIGVSLINFSLSYNLQSFSHYFYHVLPRSFYDYLLRESAGSKEPFTIGGRFSREMNFAFMNYRGGSVLNPMDTPPQMRMNCDYNFAQEWERPYYKTYYDEVLKDKYWGHVLLKRKEALARKPVYELEDLPRYMSTSTEFVEFLRSDDSVFCNKGPLEIDVRLFFKKVPAPFRAFLVVSVETESVPQLHYTRIALNWLDDDLSGESKRLKLTTGSIPADFKSIVLYLWNIDQKPCEVSLHALKVFELKGDGVNVEIPEVYYSKLFNLTQKPQL